MRSVGAGVPANQKQIAVLVALTFPIVVNAAQLGRLEVFSSVGQPLVAEIQVNRIADNERDGLVARMADAAAFQAARLEPSVLLSRLKLELVSGLTPDKAIIRITSSEPLPARFLDTLVELSWAGGKVAREYTLPLERKADPVVQPKQDEHELDETAPIGAQDIPSNSANKPNKSNKLNTQPPSAKADTQSPGWVVQPGETLSSLAKSLYPDANSLEQAMAALYEANPEAFIGGSINLIRAGAKLKVPAKETLSQRTRNNARGVLAERSVRAQSVANRLSANPSNAQGNKESATVSGTIGEGDTKNDVNKEDQLKVGRGKDTDGKSDKANVAAEELLAKDKALKEANDRIAILEKSLSDLQKLIDLKSKNATKTEDKVADVQTTAAATEPAKPEQAPAATPTAAPASTSEPEATEPSEQPTLKTESDALKPSALVQHKGKQWLDWLVNQPWLLGGTSVLLGSATAALAIGLRRRRKKKLDAMAGVKLAAMSPPVMKPASDEPIYAGVSATIADDLAYPDQNLGHEHPTQIQAPASPAASPSTSSARLDEPTTLEPDKIQDKLEFPIESEPTGILGELNEMAQQLENAKAELIKLQDNASETSDENPNGDSEKTIEQAPAIELDIPNPPLDEATWQELATKLDLAGAYVEIGDSDGASDLLEEVIKRGDVDQVKKAKELLATI